MWLALVFTLNFSFPADQVWTGNGADDLYANPANWTDGYLPVPGQRIILDEAGGQVLVQAGDVLEPRKILGPRSDSGDTMTLTFEGGSLTNNSYWVVGNTAGGTGIVHVAGSACNVSTRDLALGRESGSAQFNVNAGSVTVYGTGSGLGLMIPGDSGAASEGLLNLAGGEVYAEQLSMYTGGVIRLGGGSLILSGDQQTLVNDYIAQSLIVAEDGSTAVKVQYDGQDTTLTCEADQVWTGSGTNDLYANPENWAAGHLPISGLRVVLDEAAGRVLVQDGDILIPRKILGPRSGSGEPMVMTFEGGSLVNNSYWSVANISGGEGVINVCGSSSDIYTRDLILGSNGGRALLNVSNGVVTVYGTTSAGFSIPGDAGSTASVKIAGGELYAGKLTMYEGGIINILGSGSLVLAGDCRSQLTGYVDEAQLVAEYGSATVQISYDGQETTATSSGSTFVHTIVVSDPEHFYGWPANEGVWNWGDEIVVGFNEAAYCYNPSGHSASGEVSTVQARSFNGGIDWQLESPDTLNDSAILAKHSQPLTLTHSDFAFKTRNGRYWYSYDKAVSWSGPYELIGWDDLPKRSRTDYVVLSSSEMKLFLVANVSTNSEVVMDRSFCAETGDGCLSFSTLDWMCSEPHLDWGGNNFRTMPSTVKMDDSTYISAIRKRDRLDVDGDGEIEGADGDINKKYIDIHKTTDGGLTWINIAEDVVVGAWNPPSLIQLSDGRLCLTYGYRGRPKGIRAKISDDEGVTWGSEIILRSDAATWDMGYPRSVQRPDGKIVTMYYYSTLEIPEQHIAATIWVP